MRKPDPEYTFDERGFPTLRKRWNGELPDIPTFAETASGKRRKGQLEVMVDYVVKEWLLEHPTSDRIIKPRIVNGMILPGLPTVSNFRVESIAARCEYWDGVPASENAIWTILKKWEGWGYCWLIEEPRGFSRFTKNGVEWGIDEFRRLEGRAKKRQREAALRNQIMLGERKRAGATRR